MNVIDFQVFVDLAANILGNFKVASKIIIGFEKKQNVTNAFVTEVLSLGNKFCSLSNKPLKVIVPLDFIQF